MNEAECCPCNKNEANDADPSAESQDNMHWADVLISRLNDEIKLVGPTISCEGNRIAPGPSGIRANPHVQSYLLALDRVSRMNAVRVITSLFNAIATAVCVGMAIARSQNHMDGYSARFT